MARTVRDTVGKGGLTRRTGRGAGAVANGSYQMRSTPKPASAPTRSKAPASSPTPKPSSTISRALKPTRSFVNKTAPKR